MKKWLKKIWKALKKIGKLIIKIVKLTYKWLKEEVKERLDKKSVVQIVIILLKKLLEKCENIEEYEELKKLKKKGNSIVWADVKKDGEIKNIEIVEAKKDHLDKDVVNYLGKDEIAVIED